MNFRGKLAQERVGFQVVPMIDILFLLLCFFVISQVFTQWEAEIDITLLALLQRLAGYFPGQPVIIRADRQTAYEHLIRVLDLCRQSDIWNVSFATLQAEEPPRT